MEAFTKHGLVADVIDAVPPGLLKITYGSTSLTPGGNVTPTQAQNKPSIEYSAEEGAYYTLLLNDPDAPSREDPKFGEFHHWLVTNIPGSDISNGQEMTQYIGSGAPKGTGLHRYVFLLYKQPNGKMDFSSLPTISKTSAEGRRCHKARDFAKKFGLEMVAGNFFLAEYDDYVPTLHAQLGFKPQPKA